MSKNSDDLLVAMGTKMKRSGEVAPKFKGKAPKGKATMTQATKKLKPASKKHITEGAPKQPRSAADKTKGVRNGC